MSHHSSGSSAPPAPLKAEAQAGEDPEPADRRWAFSLAPFPDAKAPVTLPHDQRMRPPTPATPPVPPLRTFGATRPRQSTAAHQSAGGWPVTSDALVRPVLPRLAGGLSALHVTPEESPPPLLRVAAGSSPSGWRKDELAGGPEADRPVLPPLTYIKPTIPSDVKEENDDASPKSEDSNSEHHKPVKTARRREQCRTNQARYRERQKLKAARAEEEVACLRELIGLLEVRRSAARAYYYPGPEYARQVTASLFRRFRRGLSGANYDAELTSKSPEWTNVGRAGRNLSLLKQIAYVRCIMSKHVDLGSDLHGPDALLEQCWRYSVLYTNFRLELLAIDPVVASHSKAEHVMAHARLHVGVTERTLAAVFPDLRAHLRQKLLGQTLVFNVKVDLEFEKLDGSLLLQLTRFVPQLDAATALMDNLRNLREVEEVLRRAQMTPDGWIRGVPSPY